MGIGRMCMAGRIRERLPGDRQKALAYRDRRSDVQAACHRHVLNAAFRREPVQFAAQVNTGVLQGVHAPAHGRERIVQPAQNLIKVLDNLGFVPVNNLESLYLQDEPREQVSHGVMNLPRNPRALGERRRMRLVLARINKLCVLLAQGDEPVIEVVLQAMQPGLPLQHARRPHGKREREERGYHKLAHHNHTKPTSWSQACHECRWHQGQPAIFEPCGVVA